MAPLTGTRTSGNILSDSRKIDMSEKVLELQPDAQPLTILSAKAGKRVTVNTTFNWLEDDLLPRFDMVNNGAGYASGATSVVVDNGSYFEADDTVYVTRTGELMLVTAVSTNTLTVTRGVGSTAAALVDNDELLIVASAAVEGADKKAARSTNPTKVTNYTQIFRNPFDETRSLMQSDQFTRPHDWERQANHTGIEHQKDKEQAFLYGRPSEAGTPPRRTTAGCLHYIATNQTDAGGALTEAEFFGALRPAFRYGSKTKLALAAQLPVDVLNTFPRGKVQVTDQSQDTYGVRVMRYVSPHGTLNVVTHYLLDGAKFGGYIVILDLDQIAQRYLNNEHGSSDTHIRTNIQAPGVDGRTDEYLAECGLQFGLEKTHALITNITG